MPFQRPKLGKRCPYTEEEFQAAMEDVKKGIPLATVAEKTNIPRATLGKHQYLEAAPRCGRKPVLGEEDEKSLVIYITLKATYGDGLTSNQVKDMVRDIVIETGKKTPWKNSRPGKDWFCGFMGRHPKLSCRKAEAMPMFRVVGCDPFIIFEFYGDVGALYRRLKITPRCGYRLLNADESPFKHDPETGYVVATKGEKHMAKNIAGTGKESTTVLACGAADGTRFPPLIVFPGTYVWSSWISSEDEYPGTAYTAQKKGWMEGTLFCHWFEVVLLQNIPSKETRNGVKYVLFFDGASCHVNLRLIHKAMEHDVELVKLPPNVTHYLQPLDRCVFKPLKDEWKRLTKAYSEENGRKSLDNKNFARLLRSAWEDGFKPKNLRSGFEATGLFPLNPDKFPKKAFDPIALERYETSKAAKATKQSPSNNVPDVSSVCDQQSAVLSNNVPETSCVRDQLSAALLAPSTSGHQPGALKPTVSALHSGSVKPSATTPEISATSPAPSSVDSSLNATTTTEANSSSVASPLSTHANSSLADFIRRNMGKRQADLVPDAAPPKRRKLSQKRGEILTSAVVYKRMEAEAKANEEKARKKEEKAREKEEKAREKEERAKNKAKAKATKDQKVKNNAGKGKKTVSRKLVDDSDSESSEAVDEPDPIYQDESDGPESFSDFERDDEELLAGAKCDIDVRLENYYAVFYDIGWYLGRIIDFYDEDISKVKFLKGELDQFIWPKADDVQMVRNDFIFYGPLNLKGSGPFELSRADLTKIKAKFSAIKSRNK